MEMQTAVMFATNLTSPSSQCPSQMRSAAYHLDTKAGIHSTCYVVRPFVHCRFNKWSLSSPCADGPRFSRLQQPLPCTRVSRGLSVQAQAAFIQVGHLLPAETPIILYESLAAAVLAIVIVKYQQRRRGWSNQRLVQVRDQLS